MYSLISCFVFSEKYNAHNFFHTKISFSHYIVLQSKSSSHYKHCLYEKPISFNELIGHPASPNNNKKTCSYDMIWYWRTKTKKQTQNVKPWLNRFVCVFIRAHFQIDLRHIMSAIKVISIAKSLYPSIDHDLCTFE